MSGRQIDRIRSGYRDGVLEMGIFKRKIALGMIVGLFAGLILACAGTVEKSAPQPVIPAYRREDKIPANAVKVLPGTDENPPVISLDGYEAPVPIPGKVNTAGAEDSPFITDDGNTLYFFFTPDVAVPVEKQLADGVTGVYVSHKTDGEWGEPERVILQDPGKLALDGCVFVLGNVMWFCSVRDGYQGMNWFTALYKDGKWGNWQIADFPPDFKTGELHITGDGNEMYFASDRPGGKGGLDIWVSEKDNGTWQPPVNVTNVNTSDNDGWPAVSPDGNSLWLTRNYGIWRSQKAGGLWQKPELVLSPLAGEVTMDRAGNLYFVHHFYSKGRMIEADIYVAYKK